MAAPPLVLRLDGSRVGSGFLQPFADFDLWSDRPVMPGARAAARPQAVHRRHGETGTLSVFDDDALLDGELQRVRVERWESGGFRVRYASGETFEISGRGEWIGRTAEGEGEADAGLLSRALGPPMALALALRGVHLLHASALATSRGVLAFTAPSGGGKSTLAAAALGRPEYGFTRAGDDILAVRLGSDPMALPAFPQLKLGEPSWYPEGLPARLPLLALLELDRSDGLTECRFDPHHPTDALRVLAYATVAAKAFDSELLAAHLDALTIATRRLPVFRFEYPSGLDELDQVLAELARWSSAL